MNSTDLIKFSVDVLKADPNYANVDLSASGAFYNLTILPFSVLTKPLRDLINSNINALALSTMTSDQLNSWATNLFLTRRTDNLMTVTITIYLTNSTETIEPLMVYTTDTFTTNQNKIFYPIQDYIFIFSALPVDSTGNYRYATIIASSTQDYSITAANTITSTSLTHPSLSYVTNAAASSTPIEAETDIQFISSIQSAISARNNTTANAIYTNLEAAYTSITDILALGYNDPEMQRDIAVAARDWSGHFGGMTDIYVRTPLTAVTATVTGTRNSTNNGYTFTLRKYAGYDWDSIDVSSPTPLSLTPWIAVTSTNPLPSMPVVLFDWADTTITNTTIATATNGLPNVLIEVMPDPELNAYGKNYRYSIYENLRITVYTNTVVNSSETIVLAYSTLSNIEDMQTYMNSSVARVLTSNNLVKSFIPIEIMNLTIVYDSNYTIDTTTWATNLAGIINGWNSTEPIRFSTLVQSFPAPVRLDEVWSDTTTSLPYLMDSDGTITATNISTSYPSYVTMLINNIDGSSQYYLSTRQIYPKIKTGLSSTYRTCRYFIDSSNINFVAGTW